MGSERLISWSLLCAVLALGCSDSGSSDSNTPGAGGGGTGGSGGSSAGTGGKSGGGGTSGASSGGQATGGAAGSGVFADDTFLPWHGGPEYYAQWENGPPTSAEYFPRWVWLQSPGNAEAYADVGINVFTGLWEGPTEQQLTDLAAASMPTICDQGGVYQAHLDDPTIMAWLQQDEPDNAQDDGMGGYDPCIAPSEIQARYETMVANDATRPVLLNLGRGVADTEWIGRGDCTGDTSTYPEYAKGADILSYDIYPVNEGAPLEIVAAGIDNLREWSNYEKPVIMDIEASNFNDTARPTPENIETEVWMAIVHGAAGIEYFCHRFQPTFSETDCLDDAPTAAALTSINAELGELAPVLNLPAVGNGVSVESSDTDVPVDVQLKRDGDVTYLFAVAMRDQAVTATFTLSRFPATASVEVLGEDRSLDVTDGIFSDDFAGYQVHRYRITLP